MAFYLDMSSLIQMFGTNLMVHPKATGDWVDGQWVETESEPVSLYEPFLTFSITSSILAGQLISTEQGDDAEETVAWFSEHDFPEGTLVEHNDVRYRVTGKQSFKDYSNVIQYELKTEEALNGNTDV